jgi:hypothetical protein
LNSRPSTVPSLVVVVVGFVLEDPLSVVFVFVVISVPFSFLISENLGLKAKYANAAMISKTIIIPAGLSLISEALFSVKLFEFD